MKQRPILVMVIAALLLLNGILTLANSMRFELSPVFWVFGIVAIVLSIGVWQLWSWAWWGTILLQVAALGFAFYDWFTGGPIDFLAIFLGAGVIAYMLQAGTRAAFAVGGASPAQIQE